MLWIYFIGVSAHPKKVSQLFSKVNNMRQKRYPRLPLSKSVFKFSRSLSLPHQELRMIERILKSICKGLDILTPLLELNWPRINLSPIMPWKRLSIPSFWKMSGHMTIEGSKMKKSPQNQKNTYIISTNISENTKKL